MRPISGWTPTGNFQLIQYGAVTGSGAFPTASNPGPANRGSNFFAGGPGNPASSATQVIDLTAAADLIDTGAIDFELSGYLGGWQSQRDNATLTVTFKDGAGLTLGSAAIGPVTQGDRTNQTALLLRSSSGDLPFGTRSATLRLDMTRLDGSYNDGYADELSFVLTAPSGAGPAGLDDLPGPERQSPARCGRAVHHDRRQRRLRLHRSAA